MAMQKTAFMLMGLFLLSGPVLAEPQEVLEIDVAGMTCAIVTSSFPLLVTIAQHKLWVFAGSGGMLLVSGWLMYRLGRACPADPELGRLCDQTQVWNRRIYWSSVTLWGIGFVAAYLALPLRIFLDL